MRPGKIHFCKFIGKSIIREVHRAVKAVKLFQQKRAYEDLCKPRVEFLLCNAGRSFRKVCGSYKELSGERTEAIVERRNGVRQSPGER